MDCKSDGGENIGEEEEMNGRPQKENESKSK